MVSKLVEDIRNNLTLTITISIFLIIVIKEFLSVFNPEKSSMITLQYSILVGVYIIIYIWFSKTKEKIAKNQKVGHIINGFLLTNLGILAGLIFYLPSTELMNTLAKFIRIILSYLFMILLYGMLVISFILLLSFIYLGLKKNN